MTLEQRQRLFAEAVEELRNLDQAERALHAGDVVEAARSLAKARQRRLRTAPAVPVAVTAKLLKVSEPTIRSWLATGILEDAGTKPRGVKLESIVRIQGLLAELRERGHDRNVRSALLARLDDELTLEDERLRSSTKGMRRGRGDRPIVAGSGR